MRLTEALVNFKMDSVETIFVGRDEHGAHIYTVEDEAVRCHDSVGFAAIGIGYWHSNSQFMLAGHNYEATFEDTLLLTYIAKKRAEVAPGVGKGTDMFMVGPDLGAYTRISENIMEQLHKTYTDMIKKEKKSLEIGRKETHRYVQKLIEAAEAAEKAQDGEGGAKQ